MKVKMEVVRHSFNVAYYILSMMLFVYVDGVTEFSFEKND